MSQEFGRKFRRWRKEAGLTMGDVARKLNLSIPYISDIERGNRPPPRVEILKKAARTLGQDPQDVVVAAARSRGAYELSATPTHKHREVGASLLRSWEDLSPEKLEEIERVLKGGERRSEE